MLSWWNSLQTINLLNTIAQWSIVSLGAIVLVLTWRQSHLQGQVRADEKQTADKALAEANQKLIELQPKPLKDRILAFLDALDPQIVAQAKTGKNHTFEKNLTHAQNTDYQTLCEEDQGGRYIIRGTPEIMIGGFGGQLKYPAKFTITDELVK